jgi:hypothetical protein
MPHHHEWLENEERKRSLSDIASRLEKIAKLLAEKGEFKLGNNQIKPSDPSILVLRYERMPKGELSFKIEIKWDQSQLPSSQEKDLEIQ